MFYYKEKIIKKFYFLLFFLLLIFTFQNCSYQGNLVIFDKNSLSLSSNSSSNNSGNGGVYEGKLSLVLHYKNQTIYSNSISLFSGESFTFDVSGGTPPYQLQLLGTGSLDTLDRIFTAAFSLNSIEKSQILIKDSSGESATIFVDVKSFIVSSKISYPDANTEVPSQDGNSIVLNGQIYNVSYYVDHQFNSRSVIRKSIDNGVTWFDVKEISDYKGQLKSQGSLLYLFDYLASGKDFYYSNDFGLNWIRTNKIPIENNINIFFTSENKVIAVGRKYNSIDSRWIMQSSISEDNGKTWSNATDYDYGAPYNLTPFLITGDQNGNIWIVLVVTQNQTNTLIVRYSNDYGMSWVNESLDTNLQGSVTPRSIISDSKNNLYLSVDRANASDNFSLIYKRTDSSSLWSKLREVGGGISNTSDTKLFYFKDNSIFAISTPWSGSQTYYRLEKTIDSGATWQTLINVDYGSITFQQPSFIFPSSDGSKILATSTNSFIYPKYFATYLESIDGGFTWKEISRFKPLSLTSGNYFLEDILEFAPGKFISVGYSSQDVPTYGKNNWNVRVSLDGGEKWNSSDTSIFNPNKNTAAKSVLKTKSGDLFVVGKSYWDEYNGVLEPNEHWKVRKSTDNGVNWKSSDTFRITTNYHTYSNEAQSIIETKSGSLLVSGYSMSENGVKLSLIRKSNDKGTTWYTVDSQSSIFIDPKHILKTCGSDIIYKISSGAYYPVDSSGSLTEFQFNQLRFSKDEGESWQSLSIKDKDSVQINILISSLICKDDTIFLFGTATEDGIKKLKVLKSNNNGIDWSQIKLKYTNIIPNSVVLLDDYFWIGGSRNNLAGVAKWSIVKSSLDFLEMAEVDKPSAQEFDNNLSSKIKKIFSCSFGLCVVGDEQSLTDGTFTRIKKLKLSTTN